MANPTLRTFERERRADPFMQSHTGDAMTVDGTITKSGILLALLAAAFAFTYDRAFSLDGSALAGQLAMAGGLGGFVVSIILSFKPRLSPMLAPVFAVLEGLLLGAISASFEMGISGTGSGGYSGIVLHALIGTVAVFLSMLLLYRLRIIRVTERMRAIVSVAMLGVFLTYLVTFGLSLFHTRVPGIFDSSPIGIGFSLLVIGIASFMLLVDFDMIERGAAEGAPKYMEWYGAFALLVTLVWIYLEILRLLSKLRD